jgi:hypothetical protein
MDGPWKLHAKVKQARYKKTKMRFQLYEELEFLVVTRNCRKRMGSYCVVGTEFQ